MKLSRSVQTECESRSRFGVRALHLHPVLITRSAHQAQYVSSELVSLSAGITERRSEFQFGDRRDMSRGWWSNQSASVNRRYRLPLGVGLEFGRSSHDRAHLTAPVTELTSEVIRQEVF
jgi:hypothetical protein